MRVVVVVGDGVAHRQAGVAADRIARRIPA
jgi:hypothetical protein